MFVLFALVAVGMAAYLTVMGLLVLCSIVARGEPQPAPSDPDRAYVERGLAELQAFLRTAAAERRSD